MYYIDYIDVAIAWFLKNEATTYIILIILM